MWLGDSAIPVFIINLERDVQRWRHIEAVMRKLGILHQRITAIDGQRKLRLIRKVIARDFFNRKLGRPLTPGEICCALSHISALKRVIRQNLDRALILEDDVEFSDGFQDFFRDELPEFLELCDIVKIEGLFYDHTSRSGPTLRTGRLTKLIVPLSPTLGSAGYAVTRRGARALLRRFVAINWPMDHMLVSYEGYAATFGEIRPMLIQQAAHPSNIEVDRRRELDSSKRGESVTNKVRRRLRWLGRGARRTLAMARIVAAIKFSSHRTTTAMSCHSGGAASSAP
jgi:glycosyl transferase family 25